MESAEVAKIPHTYMSLDKETAAKAIKLYEQLDDHDDVQTVYTNFEIPDELYQELSN